MSTTKRLSILAQDEAPFFDFAANCVSGCKNYQQILYQINDEGKERISVFEINKLPLSSQALPSLTKSTQCGMGLTCKLQKIALN